MKTSEYYHLIKLLKQDYLDILKIDQIGFTINSKPIYSISFKENSSSTSGMLFTGIHHGREPISLLMNVYIILKILYSYQMGNFDYKELVYTRNIHFIPLINVDGYDYNIMIYDTLNKEEFGLARKNRRNGKEFDQCNT